MGDEPCRASRQVGSQIRLLSLCRAGAFRSGDCRHTRAERCQWPARKPAEHASAVSGTHTYKFGGEYRRPLVNSVNDTFKRGQINFLGSTVGAITFSPLANFLAGFPSTSSTVILRGGTRRDTFSHNLGLFAQDDWKVNAPLTLNLGLRYEYTGVFADAHKQISNFVPSVGLVQVGDSNLPRLYRRDRNNFAPRLGLAYDVTGKS
jgi:outer membrane receptor protein involved in Fe transport